MKYLMLVSLLFISVLSKAQQNYYLLSGTYTSGKSEGIYVLHFNSGTGEASQVFVAKGISNPSFLAISPNGKFVYAVEELNGNGNAGKLVSYSFNNSDGSMTRVNDMPSGGDDPCYVTIDKSGKWAIVGNYSSGSVSVLPVKSDGALGESVSKMVDTGRSIHIERQEKPHVHSTVLNNDNTFLYVPDLGSDKVMIFVFNSITGKLIPAEVPFVAVKPGSGPRHFVIHPNGRYAYLMEELTGTVTAFSVNKKNGALLAFQTISALKPGFSGSIGAADIHISPDSKFLYTSNRGDANDITLFKIKASDGKLTYIMNQPVLGKKPRNFTIDPSGSFLLVANQETDEIVIFNRDKKTGRLTDSGKRIQVPNPVCLKWVKQ